MLCSTFTLHKGKDFYNEKTDDEGGYNKYLENCRQRNLREGTICHYRQSYTQFYKYFDLEMPEIGRAHV